MLPLSTCSASAQKPERAVACDTGGTAGTFTLTTQTVATDSLLVLQLSALSMFVGAGATVTNGVASGSLGFQVSGADFSETAIDQAKTRVPDGTFMVGPLDQVLAFPGVVQADTYLTVGETIRPVRVDGDRRGYVIATADTNLEALARAEAAARLLDVEVVP